MRGDYNRLWRTPSVEHSIESRIYGSTPSKPFSAGVETSSQILNCEIYAWAAPESLFKYHTSVHSDFRKQRVVFPTPPTPCLSPSPTPGVLSTEIGTQPPPRKRPVDAGVWIRDHRSLVSQLIADFEKVVRRCSQRIKKIKNKKYGSRFCPRNLASISSALVGIVWYSFRVTIVLRRYS